MQIVEENAIPIQINTVPADKLVRAYGVCTAMEDICRKHNGVGLAAAQIGIPWQLFIVAHDGKFRYFVNCIYEPTSDEKVDRIEGCLSLPGSIFRTKRWEEVRIIGQELVMEEQQPILKAFDETTAAIVFQHEIDHQNGVLINSIGQEVFFRPIKPAR